MVTGRFNRRWLLVAAGAAALVGVGASTAPAAAVSADPVALRDRIRQAVPPYVGYAESNGQLGLPQITQLNSVVGLFTGTTRIRAFVASGDAWRADELTPTGEHGVYRIGSTEYLWDFEANQLTQVVGIAAARLPRAADLLPPDLARRLLALAGNDPVTPLPSRRIAGRTAAGLRVTPADPQTTVGRVDIWADPVTALPLRVEVAGRTGPVLLSTEMLELTDGPPDPAVLRPQAPPGAGDVTAEVGDVAGALKVLNAPPPPSNLVGRTRVALPGTQLPGVGVYGKGLAAFVLVPTSRDIAEQAVESAAAAGGYPITVTSGRAARVTTPLLSVAVRTRGRTGSLLLGATDPLLLDRAIAELPGRGAPPR
ncbi:MAG TPA: sigma-E factor regulatory protein RseB domain-containing protein [Pseudonocardia sp.]